MSQKNQKPSFTKPSTASQNNDQTIHQRLRDIIKHLDHVLPGQAPIKDFVHHNTLHGYQHLHFTEALRSAHEITGTYGYMSQQEFTECYRQGRINKHDLYAVIRKDAGLEASRDWLKLKDRTIKQEQLCFVAVLYGKKAIGRSKFSWLIEEKNMLSSLLPYLPKSSRQRLLGSDQAIKSEARPVSQKEARLTEDLWKACLDVLNLDHAHLHPEELSELSPEHSEQLFKHLADEQQRETADRFRLHGLVRRRSDHLREELWEQVGKQYTLRGLLKKLTGYDILDDYRPGLLRHIGSFLDQGVASWHNNKRQQGFFASWKASSYRDFVRFDPELPDWQDELDSLPDDALETIIWELDHLGLDESQWAGYLEQIALELPGWSGMFLWLHNNPGYEGMTQPVDMLDYLAVRLVLERIYAQRLTRRKWDLEASLYSLHWYFHRRRSELFVRYHLYNNSLPEFLTSRANRLSTHDARFADNHDRWQKLADMILTWQQSHSGVSDNKHYTVYEQGWQLFRLMQLLGVLPSEIRSLSSDCLDQFFHLLDILDDNKTGYLWLQAYEHHYREEFFNALSQNVKRVNQARHNTTLNRAEMGESSEDSATRIKQPDAQIFFCMDDREEGIRRHLEAINPSIETFGAAAHFDVSHRWKALDEKHIVKLAPVTIDPVHEIHEVPQPKDLPLFAAHRQRHTLRIRLENILNHEIRRNLLSSSLMIAASAPVALLILAGKIFSPLKTGQVIQYFRQAVDTPIGTDIHITLDNKGDCEQVSDKHRERNDKTTVMATPENPATGYCVKEQAERLSRFLRTNGLITDFGQFVVIMGHGSTNENNPHRSAYGCGACSGKFSGPNARILAKMANNPDVRQRLREAEPVIDIPDNCWFMGAMHNTCNEHIDWYDTHLIPKTFKPAYATLAQQVEQACQHSAHERSRKFASAPKMPTIPQAVKHVGERAVDFSQARPELGHASNACAIVGRRSVSKGVFFDRRLFLISYDARVDDDEGSLLEALLLMAGPVGAGISLEYYFSRVSNNRYGAGSKITHNITGFFAVMEGAGSDLRTGLPRQMIEIHEAMRLQVMVEATTKTLTAIYHRAPALRELIENEWILLSSVDPDTGEIYYFDPRRGFIRWSNPRMPKLATCQRSSDWYAGKMEPLPPVFIDQEKTAGRTPKKFQGR